MMDDAFSLFDGDGDGMIKLYDLLVVLKRLGCSLQDPQLRLSINSAKSTGGLTVLDFYGLFLNWVGIKVIILRLDSYHI